MRVVVDTRKLTNRWLVKTNPGFQFLFFWKSFLDCTITFHHDAFNAKKGGGGFACREYAIAHFGTTGDSGHFQRRRKHCRERTLRCFW